MSDFPETEFSDEYSRLSADLLDQSMIKIKHCLNQLNDAQVWMRAEPTLNSIGNLILHLSGNLRQWGVTPFTLANDRRNRESEFDSDSRIPVEELLPKLEKVVEEAKSEWSHLATGQLLRPVDIQGFDVTHMHAILHAASHFVGHTHQIILMTRLQLGSAYKFQWTPNQERGDLPI